MTIRLNDTIIITADRLIQLTTGATASRPASPVVGQLFFDTTLNKIIVWNGTSWKEPATAPSYNSEVVPIWTWGTASLGQLGTGNTTARSSPVAAATGAFSDWIQITAGDNHAVAIRANGQAWSWGNNGQGRLGDGTVTNRNSPVSVVGGFTNWISVSAGNSHTVGVRANGQAWAWGNNTNGRLGDYTITNRSSPVSVVGGFTDWVTVSAGATSTTGLRATGRAFSWGSGFQGRLGDVSTSSKSSPVSVNVINDWTQISLSNNFVVGLRANGQAWSFGYNGLGQLGIGNTNNASSPMSVVGNFTDWINISAGMSHTLGIRANGQCWGWGTNNQGQLAPGYFPADKSSPVSIVGGFTDWVQVGAGLIFSAGLRANGQIWTWGYNGYGQLGNNASGPGNWALSPISVVGSISDWTQISLGSYHMVALRSQPRVQTVKPFTMRGVVSP